MHNSLISKLTPATSLAGIMVDKVDGLHNMMLNVMQQQQEFDRALEYCTIWSSESGILAEIRRTVGRNIDDLVTGQILIKF